MRYSDGDALGLIETLGMVPAIYGADCMLKAADVELVSYENIGSTLVTVMVRGDVAAVQAAVDAGSAGAEKIGQLTAKNVMPRPIPGVGKIAAVHGVEQTESTERTKAMGFVETFGLVFALEAADAMMKTADVELVGYENVASGYISILVQGDVAACQAAVEAGVKIVEAMDATVHSSVVIPTPHPALSTITKQYDIDGLLP